MENKLQQIQEIREACIKANPSIEDDFLIRENGGSSYGDTSYPRPIRLADVLLVLVYKPGLTPKDISHITLLFWKLKEDDLESQSKECIMVIHKMLKKK